MYNGPIPFGAELFQGNFSKGTFDELNADYVIMPGDKIAVRLWGAHKFDGILDVDAAGNLFLPEVGPVRVAGVKHADLGKVVQAKLKSVFTNNVEIYTSLINTQPVAVFVTGFVASPGRYAGGPTDSVLYFLDQAGGIDPERGSFRDIRILRDGKLLTKVDLYPFLLEGTLPRPRLEEGDVILVEGRGIGVVADGQVRHKARFEFPPSFSVKGYQLQNLAVLLNNVSHASVVGSRNGAPFNIYLPLTDFPKMMLMDNDQVFFHADTPRTTIMVAAKGAIVGASRYPVKKDTRLLELLNYIPVEPELANLNGIHVLRKSVAERQKKALHEALARLEQSALTGTSQSAEEATIRVREAELITKFIEKARTVEPDGNLVVGHNGKLSDVYLEDSDVVVIPPKSDVVLISGEVMMPQAIVFRPGLDAGDFIDSAGGFSDRANKRQILVVKPNGEVLPASKNHIAAGDHIMVLPKFDSKNLQVFKDISQILYHIAVATKVAFDL
ncbi:MAG: polysaccharide biosynthesis/export family protein [Deltaproteobacteria bacterium]|nr:polysaccharide biosynthesis/export family protein [Deltaproteobacteria bacterium]